MQRRTGRNTTEWQTLGLIFAAHGVWLALASGWNTTLWPLVLPAIAVVAAFYTSLQHETIHGHPTRFAWLNEALVSMPYAALFPYRRYRDLHLKHHIDQNLTDPLEDPESYFWPHSDYSRMPTLIRSVFRFNNTFVGRLVVGPLLTIIGFGRTEAKALWRGDAGVRSAWLLHVVGLGMLIFLLVSVFGIPLWAYFLGVVYPAAALTSMRSYAEHQAAENIGGRSAIVEAHPALALLYLNNNLHIVHHAHPSLPWYRLPRRYRKRKRQYLAANDHLLFHGYGEVARRFAFTAKQPVDHPFLRRDAGLGGGFEQSMP